MSRRQNWSSDLKSLSLKQLQNMLFELKTKAKIYAPKIAKLCLKSVRSIEKEIASRKT